MSECRATLQKHGLLNKYVEKDGAKGGARSNDEGDGGESGARNGEEVHGDEMRFVGPCFDSRRVVPGALFYCKGAHFEPRFLEEALARGAAAYVSEQRYESAPARGVPALIVSDVRKAMAWLDALFYEGLSGQLFLTGITGTKGKSTVAYFLRAILDAWATAEGRVPSALLSSIDNYDGLTSEESHMTTQENLELYRRFANATRAGCTQLTMEVTSQALKYDRTLGIELDVACFMNFGADHISDIEHSDIEDYLAAKLRIFEQCHLAVVNRETAELQRVMEAAMSGSAQRILTFGTRDDADLWASDVRNEPDGVRFVLHLSEAALELAGAKGAASSTEGNVDNDDTAFDSDTASGGTAAGASSTAIDNGISEIKLGLTGHFNVENALAAIACALTAKAPLAAIHEGLRAARVPGRMELFRAPDNKTVIVDYAHNLMSFEALFASVARDYPNSALTAVFGCPGYKAYDRRRNLAEVCARYGAAAVLTEEDSGEEPTLDICNDIATHLRAAGGSAQIIENRETAIRTAISEAPAGAVILFTGKGRETRQKRGRAYVPVPSDVQMVERFIAESSGQ
jgi:UDP-N-acetylmuramoyl-L-alanyl-D-glutamate--2,6-diaminopimelate ligase